MIIDYIIGASNTVAGILNPVSRSGHPAASTRNGSIDLLRFFGSIAIVWFHLGMPHASIALSALPMFVMLSVSYGGGKSFSNRMRRFMVPWVFWSLIYGGGKIIDVLTGHSGLGDEFHSWMLLTGPVIHLWFLPFMLLSLTILKYVTDQRILWLSAALAFLATSLVPLPWPFAQWLYVWPAVVIAATGQYQAGAIILAIASLSPLSGGAIQSFLAATAILLARNIPVPAYPWISYLSGLSLGIYLAHPLAASVTDRLLGEAYFLPTIAGAIAITIVLKIALPKVV